MYFPVTQIWSFCTFIIIYCTNEKVSLVKKLYGKGRFPYAFCCVSNCRKVQVSSIRKLSGKMLFSLLEPAEPSTTPTLLPTDLASKRKDGGKGKPCLGERTSQDLSIPQPPWKPSWKRDCYVSYWISDLETSLKLKHICSQWSGI